MSRAINQFFNGKQVLINSLLVLVLFAVIIAYGYNCLQISNQKIILTMAGIFCAILLLIYAYALILKFFQKYSIVKLFIPVIAVAGIIYIFVFPPFSAPDGIYHYQATYSLVNLLFGLHNGDGTLPMRECDAQFMQSFITGNSISDAIVASSNQYANVLESFSNYNGNTNIVDMPSREDYAFFYNDNFPQLKIFSMFGVFIARLFNLSPAILYYFGVITNFIGYATLICIAAKIAPVGKKILMVCALLPMSLHLATSYSYDSAIIAFSILLISLILKAYFGKDKINISLTVWILVIAFLLSPCKTIYAVVGIFAFFIPNKRFINTKHTIIFKVLLGLCIILPILLTQYSRLAYMAGISVNKSEILAERSGVGSEGMGIRYSISDTINDPIAFIKLLFATFVNEGIWYIKSMIGGTLGWFQKDILAPSYINYIIFIVLIACAFSSKNIQLLSDKKTQENSIPQEDLTNKNVSTNQNDKFDIKTSIVLIVLFLLSALAVIYSMYLSHTFKSDPYILGVQGRYFLPILPMLLLAIRQIPIKYPRNLNQSFVIIMLVINMIYMLWMFATILSI